MICPPSTNVILDYIQAKEGSTCLQGSLTNEIHLFMVLRSGKPFLYNAIL